MFFNPFHADPTTHALNADLHTHSLFSDGTFSPESLAALAKDRGIRLWSLTDHDTLDGQYRARLKAREIGMDYLNGVEISVTFKDHTIHVVGLGVDIQNTVLTHGLETTRQGRIERAREMAKDLAKAGIAGAYDGAMSYTRDPAMISRTHFARFLIEKGVCTHMGDVFQRFLTPGRPGYVPHTWATLSRAVNWIRQAGGVAVLAHPARYRITDAEEKTLLDQFIDEGGQALEVVTSSHQPVDYVRYGNIAKARGLAASRGSDFHSPQEARIPIGALPLLDKTLTPVWELVADRIHRAVTPCRSFC